MHALLHTLASNSTCLNTSYARASAVWVDDAMTSLSYAGNFMWTWLVFQVDYYAMPRKSGSRGAAAAQHVGKEAALRLHTSHSHPLLRDALTQPPRVAADADALRLRLLPYAERASLTIVGARRRHRAAKAEPTPERRRARRRLPSPERPALLHARLRPRALVPPPMPQLQECQLRPIAFGSVQTRRGPLPLPGL